MRTTINRRALMRTSLAAAAMAAPLARAGAQSQPLTFRIGVLTELSGPNASGTGRGAIVASQMAAEDFMQRNPGVKVDILQADHQTKPDIASAIARDWLDSGVDAITDLNNSAVAFAVLGLVRDRNRVALCTAPASSDLTGKGCGPNHVHWTYDTWSLANGTGKLLVESGKDTWYFIAADYTFGKLLAGDTSRAVIAAGGKVLGTVFTPFPETTDFSAFLLQAQASGAKVVGLANSGTNTTNCIKQAAEFGLNQRGIQLAALLLTIADVDALGLQVAQGLALTSSFYWDTNDGTRAFSKRFAARMDGKMPTMLQAGDYSAVTHYLKAATALGGANAKEGRAVVQEMKALPTDDPLFGPGSVRADGRKLNPMFLFQVKTPAESKYPWDYYKLLRTIPADQAFRPMAEGGCPMVHA
jgi:branched-chain amino acid transport system substrate-binding protein